MRVIGVVGLPGSGKGEFSRIAGELDIPVVVMGDSIREYVRTSGQTMSDISMGEASAQLRAEMGRDAIAQLTIPRVEATVAEVVIIDGIRSEAEVLLFREHFSDFYLVGVACPFAVRLERIFGRGREDDVATAEELTARDERECGWGLEAALAMADVTVTNDGSIEEYETAVRALLHRCLEEVA
ncbi:flagellar hook-basal body complex protein FliE [Methanogenium sp. S4BF]|uniref:AAA family ATPase n=1 Tax=Methanogenium sp. S4BF TaxID=1789226 RepID=UPI0024169721|nr:AAA family ATPase [Methanogenium sp. S4BF]WFN34877.1 flagellar hook-basal body complex protein FliE [Methanogenium sp. S4BF]